MRIFKKVVKWLGIIIAMLVLIFFVLLIIPEKETIAPIQARPYTQYWNMNEGFRIAYHHLDAVDTLSKTSIIYLHGGPGGYVHSSIIETLKELTYSGHDVYLYDQRGSGLSDRLNKFSDINFQAHLKDLHEIISDKIITNKVIIIGQSFGANIAAHYSAHHPEKVEKIIFSSPGALTPSRIRQNTLIDLDSIYTIPDSLQFIEPYDFVSDVNTMALNPKAIVATTGALLFDKKIISDKEMDKMLNTLASQFTKGMVCDTANVLPEEGGGGLYAYIATNNHDMKDIRAALRSSRIPMLVLQGQCDYIPFSAAYEYADLYPNSQYILIENAGHEIWWEQKEIYLENIAKFLND